MRTSVVAGAAALFAGLAACGSVSGGGTHDHPKPPPDPYHYMALQAQTEWLAGHHRAYTMVEDVEGFLLGPIWAKVHVIDGKVVSAVQVPDPGGGTVAVPDANRNWAPESWATSVEALLADAVTVPAGGRVVGEYDQKTGVPSSVYLDPDTQISDDEQTYGITDLVDDHVGS